MSNSYSIICHLSDAKSYASTFEYKFYSINFVSQTLCSKSNSWSKACPNETKCALYFWMVGVITWPSTYISESV